jgi:hypothetical protein
MRLSNGIRELRPLIVANFELIYRVPLRSLLKNVIAAMNSTSIGPGFSRQQGRRGVATKVADFPGSMRKPGYTRVAA